MLVLAPPDERRIDEDEICPLAASAKSLHGLESADESIPQSPEGRSIHLAGGHPLEFAGMTESEALEQRCVAVLLHEEVATPEEAEHCAPRVRPHSGPGRG